MFPPLVLIFLSTGWGFSCSLVPLYTCSFQQCVIFCSQFTTFVSTSFVSCFGHGHSLMFPHYLFLSLSHPPFSIPLHFPQPSLVVFCFTLASHLFTHTQFSLSLSASQFSYLFTSLPSYLLSPLHWCDFFTYCMSCPTLLWCTPQYYLPLCRSPGSYDLYNYFT